MTPPSRITATPPPLTGGGKVLRRELLRGGLLEEGAPHAVEIEAAHHGRLLDEAYAVGALLVGRGVLLNDLVAPLAMLEVGRDVDGEEGDLFLGEAVLLEKYG